MTTTRDLCRAMGAALRVPGVEKYAARLVRDGYLPRAGEEVDEHDAATLLLAVAAAPHPEQATDVIESLMGLSPRTFSWSSNDFVPRFVFGEHWTFADNPSRWMAATAIEEIADVLANESAEVHCDRLVVEQGGANATLYLRSMIFGEHRTYRMHYGDARSFSAGLWTTVEIPQASINAVVEALRPGAIPRRTEVMQSLSMH